MNEFYTRNVLEAALLAAGKPLTVAELGQLFDENTRPKVEDIRATLDALAAEYSNRGLEVKETAAGFRIQVRREFASEISRLWPERPARYSRALLETLALIAYRQPITRAEIEAVRGVAVNPNIVKTVIERNWVRVVGHRDVPGRPELLGTTREFLDYFGLRSLDELPPLAELKAMGDYNLQLELPNAGALGVDGEGDGVGAAATVALLTSDGAAEGGLGAGAPGAELVAGEADVGGEVALAGEAGAGGEVVLAGEVGVGGEVVLAGEVGVGGEIAAADGADARGVDGVGVDVDSASGDAVGDLVADAGFVEATFADVSVVEVELVAADVGALEAVDGDPASAGDESARGGEAGSSSVTGEASHDAVADAGGSHDDAAHDAVSNADDLEADRTLSSSDASKHAVESDDSDAPEPAITNESPDTLEDAADEDADEDELSADGHGSRELVAAPRDIDD
jgi:segregation and condensation protein B